MSREDNIEVFQDTERLVNENEKLARAVGCSNSAQILIPEHKQVQELMPGYSESMNRFQAEASITVSTKRSYEAASAYAGRKVCVHNFASASNPGGGVTHGATAQEESLCRCSTLYFSLNTKEMWSGFYNPHRSLHNPIHNDDCIYTPGVVVFKTDTAVPTLMPEARWFNVNVITCAAPNLRDFSGNFMNSGNGRTQVKLTDKALYELHLQRLTRVLDVAVAGGNDVVILGAFGCGAFENNPEVVARASKEVIKKYMHSFETIEFAVYCSPRDDSNYRVFKRVIEG